MSALFDWIDTPGILGDVLLLAFFAAVYLVSAWFLMRQSSSRRNERLD